MRRFVLVLAAATLGVLAAADARASDHIDGLKTTADNSADLTDLFTFTSPKDPSKLVVILNVHGIAFSTSKFSDAVDYKFRLRPIDDARTLAPSTDASREQSIVCSFSGLPLIPRQRATCNFNFGSRGSERIEFDTRGGSGVRAGGIGEKNGIKVFAGVRSDPWFLDLARTLKFNASLPVGTGPGSNGLHGQNVLSIVVEIDKARLGAPLLAITAQTVRR